MIRPTTIFGLIALLAALGCSGSSDGEPTRMPSNAPDPDAVLPGPPDGPEAEEGLGPGNTTVESIESPDPEDAPE